jgi:pantetheine-phosphate adenylyltransferase
MPRVAIYPGSFDPPTLGHVDVIRRGAGLFDELVVAIGHNPAKKSWLDLEAREHLLHTVCSGLSNVRVVTFVGLLVEAARAQKATVILRGLRTPSDFELELRNGLANRDLAGIETMFLLSDPINIFVSSSLVREIASNGGDVARYVPQPVAVAIARRVKTP